ncbi:MAG TPA: hypothetical protein P5026_13315 [Kiritimatiellia bacterium]|nr:hypothetical protein [Kiritimatiellia bacterium]
MGLSDREYMQPGFHRATKAPVQTTWWQRLRFWLWRVWHRA